YPLRREYVEPDWRRFAGYRDVTEEQWNSAQWQRAHSVKNLKEFKQALGAHLTDELYADIERDQQERATMSMLIPPQMINTMVETDLYADPVRRYMAPAYSEREPEWPSHPLASRDSLHEADMWAVEGLTHRYPTKVLAELIPTCPQYCGHCTRMDLVGNDTLQVLKYKFEMKQNDRWDAMLDYLRQTPQVRDVVVSGGDMANVPAKRLQEWLFKLMDIENIRDIRIATKGLMGIPQHFLQDDVLTAYEAIATRARERDKDVAIHTHVNAAQQVTPLVGTAVRKLLDMGYRDVRNQGVLLRGVNTSPNQLLDLCFTLLDHGKILPYYFYMCDMIPNAEHWRLSVAEAQGLQYSILGYLPGFATPRFVCDVPFVGKRWVHMLDEYDRARGISYWRKNYRTGIETEDPEALTRRYHYYDPIYTLPEDGQQWWRDEIAAGLDDLLASLSAEQGIPVGA
ncbi:MAG TPA: lysine 2,3-aminomutase, partial [Actinomycetota bacterium]|nr:lysine 2,3-aminomutase [Actinomycetota bacterium]